MNVDRQIQLNGLLLEREAAWVRVHAAEQAVAALLGEPYPWTRPVLPSDQRGRRKAAGGARTASGPRERLRKLEAGEVAYRVTYRQFDQDLSEVHAEPEALRTLLAAQGMQLAVGRIETLDAAGTVVAVLLPAP